MNNQVNLTEAEKVELSYLHLKGFRYLVRNEIGSVNVFVNKPHRDKGTNYDPYGKTRGGYDHWIETKTPVSVEEQKRCRAVELGKYEFIKWEDEPVLIEMLINNTPVPTIKPGDGVRHLIYGTGIVLDVYKEQALVDFDEAVVQVNVANLEVVE